MTLFRYLFVLTLTSAIHFNKSSFISQSNLGLLSNEATIVISKSELKTHLRGVERRIIGGQIAQDIRVYPYMGYLLKVITKKINSTHIQRNMEACGATLLSSTHALSAAHCFRKCNCGEIIEDEKCPYCIFHKTDMFTLYVGSTVANYSVVKSKLKNVYIHPEHKFIDAKHSCLHRFDIAVLKLATPFKFSDKISKINLPEPVTLGRDNLDNTYTSRLFNKGECIILGWGSTMEKDPTPFLQEKLKVALVPLIGLDKCESELAFNKPLFGSRFLCTDVSICSKSPFDKNGICYGDSGGPIICGGVQVGVSSWSISSGCVGLHNPNMYTRVDVCVKWIRDIMSGKNIDGLYMKTYKL